MPGSAVRPSSLLRVAAVTSAVLQVMRPVAKLLPIGVASGLLAACAINATPAVLSADDRTAVSQISSYLNGLQRFQADFTQIGPDGEAKGVVWLDRPGRLRVEYYRPGPRTMLANRGRLLIADHLTGATTTLPVARTPLDILLAASIPFSGPVAVTALERRPGEMRLSLVKSDAPGQGTLTLRFSDSPLALVGITIRDRFNQVTTLALFNLVRDPDFGADRFNYTPDRAQPAT